MFVLGADPRAVAEPDEHDGLRHDAAWKRATSPSAPAAASARPAKAILRMSLVENEARLRQAVRQIQRCLREAEGQFSDATPRRPLPRARRTHRRPRPKHLSYASSSGDARWASGFCVLAARLQIRQEAGEQAHQRQERADLVDGFDADMVGHPAEHGRADAGHAEGEAEEHAGHHADAAGQQFLA